MLSNLAYDLCRLCPHLSGALVVMRGRLLRICSMSLLVLARGSWGRGEASRAQL